MQVSRYKGKVKAELFAKSLSLSYIYSLPLGPIWLKLHPQSDFGQRVCCELNVIYRSKVKRISDQTNKSFFRAYSLSPLPHLAHTSHTQFLGIGRMCSDLEPSFKVRCEGHGNSVQNSVLDNTRRLFPIGLILIRLNPKNACW